MLFIAFKMAYSFCFGLRGNLDFPDFLQKQFYNINYRSKKKKKGDELRRLHSHRNRHFKWREGGKVHSLTTTTTTVFFFLTNKQQSLLLLQAAEERRLTLQTSNLHNFHRCNQQHFSQQRIIDGSGQKLQNIIAFTVT